MLTLLLLFSLVFVSIVKDRRAEEDADPMLLLFFVFLSGVMETLTLLLSCLEGLEVAPMAAK